MNLHDQFRQHCHPSNLLLPRWLMRFWHWL